MMRRSTFFWGRNSTKKALHPDQRHLFACVNASNLTLDDRPIDRLPHPFLLLQLSSSFCWMEKAAQASRGRRRL